MTEAPPPELHLPHALDAEHALLGCVLYDNEAFHTVDELEPKHFSEPFHQRLWEHMVGRIAKGAMAEPMEIDQRFGTSDEAYAALGGIHFLIDMVDRAPPKYHAHTHAETIKDAFVRRSLVEACDEAAAMARLGEEPGVDILAQAESAIFKIGEGGSKGGGFFCFAEGLDAAIELAGAAMNRDGALSGVGTGLMDLDHKLGGLHPSDLLILAGRPSMGKTALATNIAFNASRVGVKVGFFSLEMSKEQLALRLLSEVSGVSGDRIRKGEIDKGEYYRLRDAGAEIRDLPLEIDETGGLSLAKLCARARRLKRTKGLDLLVIDYLQLVTCPDMRGQNRVAEVSAITMALKALAKELHIPVLALSQLSRAVEQREDKRPQLSDLRESGSIEQDADVVMFVYREAYYLGRTEPKSGTPEHTAWEEDMDRARGRAECIIGKQRHGPIGTVPLAFNDDLTRFGNLARDTRFDDAASRAPRPREAHYSALEHHA